MLNLANYILQRRLDQNQQTTHLLLQTLLFLTVADIKSKNLSVTFPLTVEPFIHYGGKTIIPSVYDAYQAYGDLPISKPLAPSNTEDYAVLDPIIDAYKSQNAIDLQNREQSIRTEQKRTEYFESYLNYSTLNPNGF